jgi:hypothetical protein
MVVSYTITPMDDTAFSLNAWRRTWSRGVRYFLRWLRLPAVLTADSVVFFPPANRLAGGLGLLFAPLGAFGVADRRAQRMRSGHTARGPPSRGP